MIDRAELLKKLAAENQRLRLALRPFAEWWLEVKHKGVPDNPPLFINFERQSGPGDVTAGDLRRAASALGMS